MPNKRSLSLTPRAENTRDLRSIPFPKPVSYTHLTLPTT